MIRPETSGDTQEKAAVMFDAAIAHYNGGRPREALRLLDVLARLHPEVKEVHINRGASSVNLLQYGSALASFEMALRLDPEDMEAWNWRGVALQMLGRTGEARACYERVIAADPRHCEAIYNMATLFQGDEALEPAIAHYHRALALQPNAPMSWSNLAGTLQRAGRVEEAIKSYDRALTLAGSSSALQAELRWNKAQCLLLDGRFSEGWPLYESRMDREPVVVEFPQRHSRAIWTGSENLAEKTLLVHAEQGYGDVIQFCRYLPMLAKRGANVIFSVPRPLMRLLGPLPGIQFVDQTLPLLRSDYHMLLLSAPLAFGTGNESIPAAQSYLAADADRQARWAARIGTQGFKIAIAWQGNPSSPCDKGRSIPLYHFASLLQGPGVRLISLQKGAGSEQLRTLSGALVENFADLDVGPDALLDTAAIMAHVDLVVTSDTVTAHLAGALGRPVWTALQFAPEWRWQLERTDSPWYPSMRLFRQGPDRQWDGVFQAMAREIDRACGRQSA
ncbi:MAG TPA: tetratricopeptide repeat protein [Rhizomicrobium sp.]|jgi:tetratricopeptide (TPR) repeat protein